MHALLVCVVHAFIFVEREIRIGSGIYSQFELSTAVLSDVLLNVANRNNASGFHQQGNCRKRSVHWSGRSATYLILGPPVIPATLGGWCVDWPLLHFGLQHGSDQKRWSEHELVLLLQCLAVVAEVHHQGTHQGRSVESDLGGLAIDVGQKLVAQVGILSLLVLNLGAKIPRLCLGLEAMNAHQWREGRELQPAQIR